MRRMLKEFNRKNDWIIQRLQEFGNLEETKDQSMYYPDRDTIAREYHCWIDYETLCTMGLVDILLYYDGTFGLAKYSTNFHIHDVQSLQNMIKFSYGAPFDLQIKKIHGLPMVRHLVIIPEMKTNDPHVLFHSLKQLDILLHRINEYCHYDC